MLYNIINTHISFVTVSPLFTPGILINGDVSGEIGTVEVVLHTNHRPNGFLNFGIKINRVHCHCASYLF